MKHDEQLALFDGAGNKLKQLGIKPNISELKQVENDLAELKKGKQIFEKNMILPERPQYPDRKGDQDCCFQGT